MGKVRNKKNVHHSPAFAFMEKNYTFNPYTDVPKDEFKVPPVQTNIFSNVNISPDILNQKLPEQDFIKREIGDSQMMHINRQRRKALAPNFKSDGTSDAFRSLLLIQKKWKKRDRLSINSALETAIKKVDEKKLKKKKKANSLGDMDSLMDALPSTSNTEKPQKLISEKHRVSMPFKAQSEEMLCDLNTYHEVIQNPMFKTESFESMSTKIQNVLVKRHGNKTS